MTSEAPPFWWENADWRAMLLTPFSALYGFAAEKRLGAKSPKIGLPVMCVGNFTIGGGGKTPTVMALAKHALTMGLKPGILTRGYGGSEKGPHLVDSEHDDAGHVGDEPLLMSFHAPVAVASNRLKGAQLLQRHGCDLIIMDDGFQSARLHADCNLLVVDARRGIGNGHVIPAGPLRAPLLAQMRKTDALLVIGQSDGSHSDRSEPVVRAAARAAKPVFEARISWDDEATIKGRRFLAFAGLADPDKFFDTLQASGAWVSLTRSFPDHHHYSDDDINELMQTAQTGGLTLVTTEKDAVRFVRGTAAAQKLADSAMVFQIEIAFDDENAATQLIQGTLDRFRMRT